MNDNYLGIYIHFPFCLRKCFYCDFPSYAGKEYLMDEYLDSLKREIDEMKKHLQDRPVNTIFLGGGTPTLFHGEKLADLLNYCRSNFHLDDEIEITTEANPETLNKDKLKILKESGVNRISMGMQAGQDRHIKNLGRLHDIQDVVKSVDWARQIGYDNINLDLMFGLPSQTLDEWMETLELAVQMNVDHISAYSLIVEDGTPFFQLQKEGKLETPEEDVEIEMYHKGIEYLQDKGYKQYEISNFAKPGKECMHNLTYWNNKEYVGLGSSAHSFLNGQRWSNYCEISQYIDSVNKNGIGIEIKNKVEAEEERFETIIMGLRLIKGIQKRDFYNRFGNSLEYYYGDAIQCLKKDKMLVETSESIRLTAKGLDLQNMVLIKFMG